MIWLSILVLVMGVGVLSAKKPETPVKKANIGEEEEDVDVEASAAAKDAQSFSLPTLKKNGQSSEAVEWSMAKDSLESDRSEEEEPEKLRRPRANTDDFGSFVGESSPILSPKPDDEDSSRR